MGEVMAKRELAIAIVGAGRMGTALALTLLRREIGWLSSVVSGSRESAESLCSLVGQGKAVTLSGLAERKADLVWLTVPDRQLSVVAAELAKIERWHGKPLFVHASGCLSVENLRPLTEAGFPVSGLHPLQAVARKGQELAEGIFYALEPDSAGGSLLREIVKRLAGRLLEIPSHRKVLYHASAVVASNYLVVLMDVAASLLEACGLDEPAAMEVLSELVTGTWKNISRLGPAAALTGPIQRGDLPVVEAHLQAIRELGNKEVLAVYEALGRHAAYLGRQTETLPEQAYQALLRQFGKMAVDEGR